jgi:hypothetical protein
MRRGTSLLRRFTVSDGARFAGFEERCGNDGDEKCRRMQVNV